MPKLLCIQNQKCRESFDKLFHNLVITGDLSFPFLSPTFTICLPLQCPIIVSDCTNSNHPISSNCTIVRLSTAGARVCRQPSQRLKSVAKLVNKQSCLSFVHKSSFMACPTEKPSVVCTGAYKWPRDDKLLQLLFIINTLYHRPSLYGPLFRTS